MQKTFTILVVSFFFVISLLGAPFTFIRVNGTTPIVIRADGTVQPASANITRLDPATYAFTGNNSASIIVERNHIVIDGRGYTLRGNGSGTGITLARRTNCTVKDVTIMGFTYGIWLSLQCGNGCLSSSHNNIHRNTFINNENGIVLSSFSTHNDLRQNSILDNDYGILLEDSSNNTICENHISANRDAGVWFSISHDNLVSNNNVSNNQNGIRLDYSSNNQFYHNYFDNNTQHVSGQLSEFPNVWDDAYPSGGNYWSDFEDRYSGVQDVLRGPYQNETGADGFWDAPYWINNNNWDAYPIVPEFPKLLSVLALLVILTIFTLRPSSKLLSNFE